MSVDLRHLPRDASRIVRFVPAWLRRRGRYVVDGTPIALPFAQARFAHRQLAADDYERPERAAVARHLPTGLPVIELGASLGIVSAIVRRHLNENVPMLAVEANPAVLATCRANIDAQPGGARAEVLHAAIAYDADTIAFRAAANLHSNALAAEDGRDVLRVPAVTLGACLTRLGDPARVSLVCDIEGAEWDLFEREPDALGRVEVAIVETHPARYERGATAFHKLVHARGFDIVSHEEDVLVLVNRASGTAL